MAIRIRTNVPSLVAQRYLADITRRMTRSYQRLASGLRIVSAADDPAGLAMADRMRAQVRSLHIEMRDINDDVSRANVAEGALGEMSAIVIRLRELAVQANNGTSSDSDRDTLQREFGQLVQEIDRIAASTTYAGEELISFFSATELGLDVLDIGASGDPDEAIESVDGAIDRISSERGHQGARINVLHSRLRAMATRAEALTAAESRIRDLDIAAESARLVKLQILQQAALAVLAQANRLPSLALQLLEALP